MDVFVIPVNLREAPFLATAEHQAEDVRGKERTDGEVFVVDYFQVSMRKEGNTCAPPSLYIYFFRYNLFLLETVAESDLEYTVVALEPLCLNHIRNTPIVTSVKYNVLVLVRSTYRNRQFK